MLNNTISCCKLIPTKSATTLIKNATCYNIKSCVSSNEKVVNYIMFLTD
jgi:hypothetical protein